MNSHFFSENGLEAAVTDEYGMRVWISGNITIYEGDLYKMTREQLSDVSAVFDRASLIALPDWMRRDYVQLLKRLLDPNTRILLITLVYDQDEMQGPPFSVCENEVEQLYRDWCDIEKIVSVGILDDEPGFRKRGLSKLDEKVFALSVR